MSRSGRIAGNFGRIALLVGLGLGTGLVGAGRAEAQWGGGYGYGGWGWGGYGPLGGMGMNLSEQQAVKDQYFMLGMSRFNAENARASADYQAANLMQQRAVTAALENQRLAYQMAKETYDVRTQQATSLRAAQAATPQVPLEHLVGEDGRVIWPDYAPSSGVHAGRRRQADDAIQAVVKEAQADGQVAVADLVSAKRKLHDYGQPALDLLRARAEPRHRAELLQFLRALESALEDLGAPPAVASAPATGPRPAR